MIHADGVTKTFKLYQSPADRLKEILFGKKYCREFQALKAVSFFVETGETVGIIGENGAGKSTILKILTGILLPDSGRIHIDGKITGLLELGTGFNPEFTGVQNIFLNGTLLGMTKDEIRTKLDEIVAFTELQDFIDQPLKTYSSGMVMRLAFSVAIHAEPKAFVVDEALSVGDARFQQKCMQRIREFKEQGGAIVFVSHDTNAVKILCDRAILLHEGQIATEGSPDDVVSTYNFLLAKKSGGEAISLVNQDGSGKTYGNLKVQIASVELMNANHQETDFFTSGELARIVINLIAHNDIDHVVVGILVRDKFGQDIFGTNTHYLRMPLSFRQKECYRLTYIIEELNLGPGKYTLTVAAHRDDTHVGECYEWIDVVKSFQVGLSEDFNFIGLSRLKPHIQLEPNDGKS